MPLTVAGILQRGLRAPAKTTGKFRSIFVAMISFLILCTLAVVLWGRPRFLANDDIYMKHLLEGSITGKPEGELIFISKLIGLPLAKIVDLLPALPIYDFALLSTNFFAFTVLALDWRKSITQRYAWFFLVSVAFIWLIQVPTFTTTAIFSAGLAIIILAGQIRAGKYGGLFWSAVILLGISVAWRVESFGIALIVGITSLLGQFLWSAQTNLKDLRPRKVKSQGFFVSAIMLSTVVAAISIPVLLAKESCVGVPPEKCISWQEFRDYNALRGSIHGSPLGAQLTNDSLVRGSWSNPQAEQFLDFYYYEYESFGFDVLEPVGSRVDQSVIYSPQNLRASFQQAFSGIVLSGFLFIIAGFVIPTIAALVLLRAHPLRSFVALLVTASGPLVAIFLAGLVRIPDRVLIPLLFLIVAAVVSVAAPGPVHLFKEGRLELPRQANSAWKIVVTIRDGGHKTFGRTLGLLASVLTVFVLVVHHLFSPTTGFRPQSLAGKDASTAQHDSRLSPELVAAEPTLFFTGGSDLFGGVAYESPSYMFPPNVIMGGWPTFSPHWSSLLENRGIQGGLRHKNFLDGTVLLIGSPSTAQTMALAISDDVGCLVSSEYIQPFGNVKNLSVWRFQVEDARAC